MEVYTLYWSTDIGKKNEVFFRGFRSEQSDILQAETFSPIDKTGENTE
jgi:hypothetical protein